MFDIAWSELLLIAVIALIFIGPKELPHVLHGLGKAVAKLRRSADDFRRQFEDSMREAGYEDLHKNIQDFRSLNPASQLKESIDRAIQQEYTPNPVPHVGEPPVQPVLTEGTSVQQGEAEKLASDPVGASTEILPLHGSPEAPVPEAQEKPAYEPDTRSEAHASPGVRPQVSRDESINDRATPVA